MTQRFFGFVVSFSNAGMSNSFYLVGHIQSALTLIKTKTSESPLYVSVKEFIYAFNPCNS